MNNKEINNWMNCLSSRTGVETDIIRKLWLEHEDEAKNMRYFEHQKSEELTNFVKASVISDVSKILPPPPLQPQ